jgi:superfamily II DNA/RNA helicase
MNFESLGIKLASCDALKKQGIKAPTAVQKAVIPTILDSKDLIAQSATGTGKTLAFLLPVIQKMDVSLSELQCLIVVPTRELALQIAEVAKPLATLYDIELMAIYGGKRTADQEKKLERKPQMIVATPGRLMDHVGQGNIDITTIKTFILDEADQLLLAGFKPDIEEMVLQIPGSRQTLFFSATLPPQIKKMAYRYTYQAEFYTPSADKANRPAIEQMVVPTNDRQKFPALQIVLAEDSPYLAIIFCRTKRRANELHAKMKKYKFNVDVIHSDIEQNKRERILKQFKKGDLQFLIATDVAARGLDINFITHIYNFDIPESAEAYIHRIGRTGRAGATGYSCTFVTEEDTDMLRDIERRNNGAIKERFVKIGNK